MARPTNADVVSDILKRVEKKFQTHELFVKRMDDDYDRYIMVEFTPDESESIDPEDAYTTNFDRAVADKVAFSIGAAQRIIRVEDEPADQEREDANDNVERLAIGLLNIADERRAGRGDQSMQETLAWFATVRAKHIACRSVLLKNEFGETVPDVTPFDPRDFVFQRGPRGIEWLCARVARTRGEIQRQYPDFKFSANSTQVVEDDEDAQEILYDYYYEARTDREKQEAPYWNCVIAERQFAKKPAPIYSVNFPVVVRPCGLNPGVAPQLRPGEETTVGEGMNERNKYQGDSIFALTRRISPVLNRVMTYNIAITAKYADPGFGFESLEGEKTPEESPFEKGAVTPLSVAEQQKVVPYPPGETGRDAQMLLARISEDLHAVLPAQAFGVVPPGGISAAALRVLGNSLLERTRPFLRPVESCLLGVVNNLVAQFETGSYEPVQVYGKTFADEAFQGPKGAPVGPLGYEHIRGHGPVTVALVQDLPQDDTAMVMIAKALTDPNQLGQQLATPQWARTHVLKMQDSKLEEDRQSYERAKMSAPALALMDQMQAASRRGDQMMYGYLQMELQRLLMQRELEFKAMLFSFTQAMGTAAMGVAAGGMGGGNGQGTPMGPSRGTPPQMSTPAEAGITFPPSPEAGRNTTQPRPGSMSEENQRLAQIGLVRGR